MEWFSLIIPFAVTLIFFLKYRRKFAWWEPSLPFICTILLIITLKSCGESSATTDTEFYNSYIVQVERDERWEEDIECSYDCNCYQDCDSEGKNCSEVCQICYYDCPEWHEEIYRAVLNTGESVSLNKSEYYYYVKLFNGKEVFKDLHRNNVYKNHDGDRWIVVWDKRDETIQYHTSKHTYTNRIQASDDVFNYPDVDTSDVKLYDLKEYPNLYKDKGLTKQKHLIGVNYEKANRKLEILNAKLGKRKQLNTYILVWQNQGSMAGNMQEWYWKGGNKNEFIVCIGLNENVHKVDWVKVISWTEEYELKNDVRDYVLNNKENFDFLLFIDYLNTELERFKRKEFKDFEYVEVNISNGWIIAIFVLSLIFSIAINLFCISNDFDA